MFQNVPKNDFHLKFAGYRCTFKAAFDSKIENQIIFINQIQNSFHFASRAFQFYEQKCGHAAGWQAMHQVYERN